MGEVIKSGGYGPLCPPIPPISLPLEKTLMTDKCVNLGYGECTEPSLV